MRFFSFFGMAFIFWSACSQHRDSINRIVDPYYDKSMFNPNWEKGLLSPEWYYRMTVVDAEPGTQALSVEEGHWLHPENIRFEITQDYLIGWRSKASVPGTELDNNSQYKGSPVVAFKILSHFDVAPNYDSMTATKGNLITENTSNQSWYKRRFMKIDFRKNCIQDIARKDGNSELWGSVNLDTDTAYAVDQHDLANPKRPRFEKDYFEVTTRQGVKVDIEKYYGYYGEPFEMDSASPIIDIRFSFMRKPDKSNYKPLNYTDNLFDKFGFYRVAFTGQQQWDSLRGVLESKKNYNIARFNIWNEDGSPKPIIYYTSVSHPKNLLSASYRVASEWNQIFRELVFELKKDRYSSLEEVPDMFILHENNCNFDFVNRKLRGNLKKHVELAAKVELSGVQKRLEHANDSSNTDSFTESSMEEAAALDDLEKICSAFEAFTQGTEKEFKYQRSGDLRYNLLNLINKYATTNWSGLGPMFSDMQTGEIIQSQANINLRYLDQRAQSVIYMMQMMSGKIRFKELVLGSDVHKYMSRKMSQIRRESELIPENLNAVQIIQDRILNKTGSLVSESEARVRLKSIESNLLFPKIGGLDSKIIEYFDNQLKKTSSYSNGVLDPPELLDNLIVGTAMLYKTMDAKTRFLKIRESVYTAVALHEIGHNLGLTHNMSASSDALNYGKKFWKIQSLPVRIFDAIQATKNDRELQKNLIDCYDDADEIWKSEIRTQDCFRQQELMYSSIMDYHASWNADIGGLGLYDKAAIFFGYGQLVEILPKAKFSNLARWVFLNDWKKIPSHLVDNYEQVNQRKWVSYQPHIQNEVPYRFCIDGSGQSGPHCKAFDFGADMRGRAARNKTQYWNHYFLTHFARDRIWNLKTDLSRVVSQDLAIFEDFNQIMRWYGYYLLTDNEFAKSDAAKDYLAATVLGLNHYSHVIGHPVSGEHITKIENTSQLFPIDELDACEIENIIVTDDSNNRMPLKGHGYSNVFLGDGRPFTIGLNNDYEEYHLNYVGSFYPKLLAGYFLAYPRSYYPRVNADQDNELSHVSWYRFFPEEIGGLFSNLILSEWSELGPLISPTNDLVHRDILNPVTLKKPDYLDYKPVIPAHADMLSYRSLFYTTALLSNQKDSVLNPIHGLQIGIEGASDDRKSAYTVQDLNASKSESLKQDVVVFESPNGYRYWAKKATDFPVAFDYLKKLNNKKKEIKMLEDCVSNLELRNKSVKCSCLKLTHEGECCSSSNPECPKAISIPCSDSDLKLKIERYYTELENSIGFADDMRQMVNLYNNL